MSGLYPFDLRAWSGREPVKSTSFCFGNCSVCVLCVWDWLVACFVYNPHVAQKNNYTSQTKCQNRYGTFLFFSDYVLVHFFYAIYKRGLLWLFMFRFEEFSPSIVDKEGSIFSFFCIASSVRKPLHLFREKNNCVCFPISHNISWLVLIKISCSLFRISYLS